MLDKLLTVIDKFINYVLIVFFLFLIVVGGYAFFDSYKIYDSSRLDDGIVGLKPKSENNFDFASLKKINKDIDGWITLFETTVDYPVVHSRDNYEYLNLDYKREYSTGGSIFVDYRNNDGFVDDYTITYGHNMMTGQMYSDIKNYENLDYFNQHLYGVLYTENDIYKLEVLYLAKVNAYEDDIYNLSAYANGHNDDLVKIISRKAEKSNIVNAYDKLLLLSTCDSYGSNDRSVLLVAAKRSNSNEVKTIEESVKANVVEGGQSIKSGAKMFKAIYDLWWVILAVVIILVLFGMMKWYFKKRKVLRNNKK